MTALADLLRDAVTRGDFGAVPFAEDVVLRTSNEAGRARVERRAAVLAHLAGPGPGTVAVWEPDEWSAGVALTFEWVAPDGAADRRRWYVRAGDRGEVREVWIAAARPATGVPPLTGPPEAWLAELGATGVRLLAHGGNSGAALVGATLAGGEGIVLKRVVSGGDWLARATNDDGRTSRLHAAGAFARMPAAIETGVLGVCRDGDTTWIAMRDVSALLLADDARFDRDRSRTVLRAAAAMHRAFDGAAPDGAATLEDRLGMSAPAVSEAERTGSDLLPKQFEHAWEAFADVVDADVADAVLALVAAPGRLADALRAAYGTTTLVHGDLRDDNLGFEGDRVVLIDWDLATAGTPTVDFAWYLAQDAWRIDASHDELETDHRAAQGEHLREAELELGMLSGLVQYGWLLAHSARVHPDPAETAWGRAELDWWVPRARLALERTGGV